MADSRKPRPRRSDEPNLTVEHCERCGRAVAQLDAKLIWGTHEDVDVVCPDCVTELEAAEGRVLGEES